MTKCFFVSDLHGRTDCYQKLFLLIEKEKPDAVFFGGDLLPHFGHRNTVFDDFVMDYFFPSLRRLQVLLTNQYPQIFLILGNDDARIEEQNFLDVNNHDLFCYVNQQKAHFRDFPVFGYCFVPPTPFRLKDWEKYDVSQYADPGCIHPDEGFRTTAPDGKITFMTIQKDLEALTRNEDVSNAIFLFHSPPYLTFLDRAALDGKMIDHVPLDVNVGSIAIKRFIDEKQPLVTLHGHIHESTRITGKWSQKIGRTFAFNAAHDGSELSVIIFDLEDLTNAKRILF